MPTKYSRNDSQQIMKVIDDPINDKMTNNEKELKAFYE